MNNYFYAVAGVIILLALFENILPNSSTGKSAKTVISVVCVVIILSPIVNIVKGSDSFNETGSSYNEYLQNYQNQLTEKSVKLLLETEDFLVDTVSVQGEYISGNYLVNKITIKLENLVINDDSEHINIIENIENLLASRLNILKAEIIVE